MPPSKRTVPPVLLLRSMPPPALVEVMLPLKSTVPAGAARDLDDVARGGLVDRGADGDVAGAAVDVDADAAGSLVAPMVPPLMVTVPAELVMSMPSPVWPSMSTLPIVSEPDMPLRLMPPSVPPREVTEIRVALNVRRVDEERGAVVGRDLVGAARVEDVDGAGALRAEAEGAGAVDGDVDAAVEVERAVGRVVGLQVDAVAVGAAVVEDGDLAAEGEGRTCEFETAMPSVVASSMLVAPVTAKAELSTLTSWIPCAPPLARAAEGGVERAAGDTERAAGGVVDETGGERVHGRGADIGAGERKARGVAEVDAVDGVAAVERHAAVDDRIGAARGLQRGAVDGEAVALADQLLAVLQLKAARIGAVVKEDDVVGAVDVAGAAGAMRAASELNGLSGCRRRRRRRCRRRTTPAGWQFRS